LATVVSPVALLVSTAVSVAVLVSGVVGTGAVPALVLSAGFAVSAGATGAVPVLSGLTTVASVAILVSGAVGTGVASVVVSVGVVLSGIVDVRGAGDGDNVGSCKVARAVGISGWPSPIGDSAGESTGALGEGGVRTFALTASGKPPTNLPTKSPVETGLCGAFLTGDSGVAASVASVAGVVDVSGAAGLLTGKLAGLGLSILRTSVRVQTKNPSLLSV